MTDAAYHRVDNGEQMPGLIIIHRNRRFSDIIDDLVTVIEISVSEDWQDSVKYIPFY